MLQRAEENRQALALLGRTPIDLGLLEGQYPFVRRVEQPPSADATGRSRPHGSARFRAGYYCLRHSRGADLLITRASLVGSDRCAT